MDDRINLIVDWYSNHWINSGANGDFAILYGWLACASLVVLILTLLAGLVGKIRLNDGIKLAGQHVIVFGLPFLWSWGATWL